MYKFKKKLNFSVKYNKIGKMHTIYAPSLIYCMTICVKITNLKLLILHFVLNTLQ